MNIDWLIIVSALVTNFCLMLSGYFIGRRAGMARDTGSFCASLDEEDLVCLLSGGILAIVRTDKLQIIKMCLKDIGYDRMSMALVKVVNDGKRVDRIKIIT